MRLAVLISGGGSNLQAFIDACAAGSLSASIELVVSNRAGVKGLERADEAGIRTAVIDHRPYDSREAFDQALVDCLLPVQPDLVILAGFMRILTPTFITPFAGRLLNIHPSLLPLYPGLNTHQRALDAGDSHAGATVHFVTEELDGGPPIVQCKVAIHPEDTAATLASRILIQEHRIYPLAASWLSQGRLCLKKGTSYLDGEALPATGYVLSSED